MIDGIATLLTVLVLGGLGVLLPAFTEDYGMSVSRHLSEAAMFFGGSAFLVISLVVTTVLIRGEPHRRKVALAIAAARLGCLVAGAAVFVVYGTLTHGL
ncbi:hypothetical protein ACE14D_03600 [Streptomyces sp. Act-28]